MKLSPVASAAMRSLAAASAGRSQPQPASGRGDMLSRITEACHAVEEPFRPELRAMLAFVKIPGTSERVAQVMNLPAATFDLRLQDGIGLLKESEAFRDAFHRIRAAL